MFARIPKTNSLILLTTLAFCLTGCGDSQSSSQRQSNSNPFAPNAGSNHSRPNNTNSNRAPSRPKPSSISQKKRPSTPSPSTALPGSPKEMTQKKSEPVKTDPASSNNIIDETRKRTLNEENPGVAIIVRGISGQETELLPVIQNELRSSIVKPSTNDLPKEKPDADTGQNEVEHFFLDKQLVLIIRPVPEDLFAFAQNLKWGSVKEIDLPNRIITIDTQQKKLTSLAAKENSTPEPSVKSPTKTDPAKPTIKPTEKKKPASANPLANDRDLKPRPGEETLDWALRVIAGTSSFAHDTACKKLVRMKPDPDQLQRVSSVLAETLPLAKTGFRMKEHVNAMSVWYTDEATQAFAALLSGEKSRVVREEIIELLPKIRSEVTAEVLVGRLAHRGDMKAARTSLKFLGELGEKPVIKLLEHPDDSLRIEACKILQAIGTQDSIEALKKRAEIEDSPVIKRLISETQTKINQKSASRDE